MKIRTITLVVAVALASAGTTYMLTNHRQSDAAPRQEHAEEASAPPKIAGLEVAPARAGDGWRALSVTGKVTVPPDRLVKISPRIEGKVVMARGTVGDRVASGQVLAVVSSVSLAEARAQYRQALTKLGIAKRAYSREKKMVELGGVSVRPLEEARSESLSAQGELSDAKGDLAQAKSELVRAESEVTQCKARLQRAKDLYAEEIVSKQDLETADAEYKRDVASVDAVKSKISQAEARVEKAQLKQDVAKQYLAREERLYKSKTLDTRALQTVNAEISAAQAEVQSAADRIRVLGADPSGSGDTIAVACPIAGRIVSRHTNVGEVASPADALFIVADLSRV